jgi:glycosyltransferase involved in cell wall biosynthesis
MYYDSSDKYFAKPQSRWSCRTPLEYGALLAGVIVKYRAEARQAEQYLGAPVHVVPNGVPFSNGAEKTGSYSNAPYDPELRQTNGPLTSSFVKSTREDRPALSPSPASVRLRRGKEGGRENGRQRLRDGTAPGKRTFVFGTAARINPQKRLEDLLAAFHLAHDRLPPYTLKIAGGVERGCADYAAGLRTTGEGLPIEWLGEMADMATYYSYLDAFVMISEPAGCPNASLEALAAGLPVIATDVGGASEQVIDGQTGRLVPARNSHALAAALIELANRSDLRRGMALGGRRLIRERFGLDRMIADYRRICLPNP